MTGQVSDRGVSNVFPAITAGLHCGEARGLDEAAIEWVFPAITAGLHCGKDYSLDLPSSIPSSRPSRPGSIAAS